MPLYLYGDGSITHHDRKRLRMLPVLAARPEDHAGGGGTCGWLPLRPTEKMQCLSRGGFELRTVSPKRRNIVP